MRITGQIFGDSVFFLIFASDYLVQTKNLRVYYMNRIKLSKMKKKYQKPAFDVVVLKRRALLLQSADAEISNAKKEDYGATEKQTWED